MARQAAASMVLFAHQSIHLIIYKTWSAPIFCPGVMRVMVGISILRSSPALRSIDIDENRATVELETDDIGLSNILELLMKSNVKIRSFNDKDPNLEDVFMQVTKGLVT